MKRKVIVTSLVTVSSLTMLGVPEVFAAQTDSSPLSAVQLNDKSYVIQRENAAIEAAEKREGWVAPENASQVAQERVQALMQAHLAQVSTPEFQQQLTEEWRQGHSKTMVQSDTMQPNNTIDPGSGATMIKTTYSADPTLFSDSGNKTAATWDLAATVACDLAGYFLSTVQNVCKDILTIVGGSVMKTEPITSAMSHTYKYGYKDVYVYNGTSWVDYYTTTDRSWYRHELSSWVDATINNVRTGTHDYLSSAVHVDYAKHWKDSDDQLDTLGLEYWSMGVHHYDWY